MEEKERYELLNDNFIYDNKLKEYVSSPNSSMKHYMETLTELLNQQNKQIKQLNEQLEYYKKEMLRDGETFTMSQAKVFDEITQENQQLKQQLKEYFELGTPKEIDDAYKSKNILNYNLQDANRIIDDLVKQLHDLPKKIVEEIREDMSKRIMEKQIKWGDNIQIGFICNAINECLDTILKKYGGENDL